MEYRLKIKDMPEFERPRERLVNYGPGALSDSELLALVLRTASRKENVVGLSQRILKEFDMKGLSRATVAELQEIYGVGAAKACQIVACFELGRRMWSLKGNGKMRILNARQVFEHLEPELGTLKKEHFLALYLNTKNYVLKKEVVSIGGLNANVVHPREIFQGALRESAASVILVHNHPSGDPSPSPQDLEITSKISEAGKVMGIEVLDHIIIGDGSFVSLKEQGSL